MVIRDSITAKANCSCVGSVNPPERPQVIGQAKISIRTVKDEQDGEQHRQRLLGEANAGLTSSRLADLAVEHRDERRREGAFGEQGAEHVGQAESDEKSVGREARPDIARLERVADKREDAADEGQAADGSQRTGEVHRLEARGGCGIVRRRRSLHR